MLSLRRSLSPSAWPGMHFCLGSFGRGMIGFGGCPTAPEAPTCWMSARSTVDCSNLKSQLDTIAVPQTNQPTGKLHKKTTAANPILVVVVVVVVEAGTEGGLHHPDHTSHCHLSVTEYHRNTQCVSAKTWTMDRKSQDISRHFPTTSRLEIFGWCKGTFADTIQHFFC